MITLKEFYGGLRALQIGLTEEHIRDFLFVYGDGDKAMCVYVAADAISAARRHDRNDLAGQGQVWGSLKALQNARLGRSRRR